MLSFATEVEVVEVGPRDGLQSLATVYPVDIKLQLLEILAEVGFRTIEVTSFTRPDVVPQLADAAEVMRRLVRRPGVSYRVLVPNLKGAERALETGADELLGLITASDSYNIRNSNMDVAHNLVQLEQVASAAAHAGAALTVAIGLAFFCPYEGDTPPERVLGIVERLHAAGVRRLYCATSIGMDGPREVHDLCSRIGERFPDVSLGLHLHNANGMALANALAGMDAGVRWFEGSIAGLGGALAAPGTPGDHGNVASEDLAALFEGMGVSTGLDLERMLAASLAIASLLGVEPSSSLTASGTKEDVLAIGRSAPRNPAGGSGFPDG